MDLFNTLVPGRHDFDMKLVIFKLISIIDSLNILCHLSAECHETSLVFGSGNGLVPLGNRSLSAPMLTKVYDHNELTHGG